MKYTKKILMIFFVVLILTSFSFIFADDGKDAFDFDTKLTQSMKQIGDSEGPNDMSERGSNSSITNIDTVTGNIWKTFEVIAQIIAIATIVVTGARYMLTSADDRADIKKQTAILILGAVLVYAAIPVKEFIQTSVESAINGR